jgi:hypothetical protein
MLLNLQKPSIYNGFLSSAEKFGGKKLSRALLQIVQNEQIETRKYKIKMQPDRQLAMIFPLRPAGWKYSP